MKEDFNKLRLKYHGDPTMMDEILQRECRYKTASKLAETLRCENFRFPSLAVAEMSTSDAVAEIHAEMIADGATVLDMTCGLGIDSFHFARKAESVTCIELDNHACSTARHNVSTLELNNVNVIEGDSIAFLNDCNEPFDYIFVDPARRNSAGRHFALGDCSPDIVPALDTILSKCRRALIIKASPMIDIKSTVSELARNCEIITIGTAKECKEVVFKIHADSLRKPTPSISCISSLTVNQSGFEFSPDEESRASTLPATLNVGGFLLEPYPAVMKSGGMKLLSSRFGVGKLHPNTHLYTCESHLPTGFPGEAFEIVEIIDFSKKSIKDISKRYPTINVATRNFPLSPPQLSAKLKTKDGGENMLFGATIANGSKLLIVTKMGQPL